MDKGFTARFDKGLFTFYIQQDNLNFGKRKFNPRASLYNISEEPNQSAFHHDFRIVSNSQELNNRVKRGKEGTLKQEGSIKIAPNASAHAKTPLSQPITQRNISRGLRTNFVVKQNKKLFKSQQRPQLRLHLQASQNQLIIKSRNLRGVDLANIFKPKNAVLSRQNPTGRANYKMSTIAYRSIRLKSQNLYDPSIHNSASVVSQDGSQNADLNNILKKTQLKQRRFKNIKLSRFDSSLYGADLQNSTRNSEKSQRYLTSCNHFEKSLNDSNRFCRSTFQPL